MEYLWTRAKIRNWCKAKLGRVTDDQVHNALLAKANADIDEAYAQVLLDATWPRAQVDTIIDVGSQQRLVSYPSGCGPGGVDAVYVWDAGLSDWVQLSKLSIPAGAHPDPVETAGGDEWQNRCGMPQFVRQGAQLELFPATDQAYQIKVRFRPTPVFTDDLTPSAVDGMLIALQTLALLTLKRDLRLSQTFEGRYIRRLRALKRATASGEPVPVTVFGHFERAQGAPVGAHYDSFPESRTTIDDWA